jgi:hypothetical protein
LLLSCAPYDTVGSNTYFGFSVGISSAPPPPRVVFVERPSVMMVPGTSVYVVQNTSYDVFQYGSFFYMSSGGYWYRSGGYGQSFEACDVRRVPRAVLTVPGNHWKHRSAGRYDDRGRDRDHDRDRDRDRDRDDQR